MSEIAIFALAVLGGLLAVAVIGMVLGHRERMRELTQKDDNAE